jgi:hypothetical protein
MVRDRYGVGSLVITNTGNHRGGTSLNKDGNGTVMQWYLEMKNATNLDAKNIMHCYVIMKIPCNLDPKNY